MSEVKREMRDIQSDTDGHFAVEGHLSEQRQEEKKDITEDIRLLLRSISDEISENPNVVVTEQKKPGFMVTLTHIIDAALVPFAISTKFTPTTVTISAADGKWDAASNVHGNWGQWTDQLILYSGPANEGKIRQVVNDAFLTWYRHAYRPM